MEKYIICSDIHGRKEIFRDMLAQASEMTGGNIDGIIIAGDLETDPSYITDAVYQTITSDCSINMVAGNCDGWHRYSSGRLPDSLKIDTKSGHRIFVGHGHLMYPLRTDMISYLAESEGCDIAVFGHTHMIMNEKCGGVLILNAGALKDRSYMILTPDNDGGPSAVSYRVS